MSSSEKDVSNHIALKWAAFQKLTQITNWQTNCQNQIAPIQRRLPVDFTFWETWGTQCSGLWDMGTQCSANQKIGRFSKEFLSHHVGNRKIVHNQQTTLWYDLSRASINNTTAPTLIRGPLRMSPDEPANIYLYSSNNTNAKNKGKPRRTYVDQISDYVIQPMMMMKMITRNLIYFYTVKHRV
jgi:hypothetical protein